MAGKEDTERMNAVAENRGTSTPQAAYFRLLLSEM
jgi:hypothetical protein